MRRALVVFLIVLFIMLCSACNTNQKEDDIKEFDTIDYQTGEYDKKDWSETLGTYTDAPVIPNKETAAKMAQAIFDGMVNKSKEEQEFVPQHIFYDEQDKVWIVSLWQNRKGKEYVVGGNCCIAMQQQDGKVLRIWFEE